MCAIAGRANKVPMIICFTVILDYESPSLILAYKYDIQLHPVSEANVAV